MSDYQMFEVQVSQVEPLTELSSEYALLYWLSPSLICTMT